MTKKKRCWIEERIKADKISKMARLLEGKDGSKPCTKCQNLDSPPGIIKTFKNRFSLDYIGSYCDCYLGQLRKQKDLEKKHEKKQLLKRKK